MSVPVLYLLGSLVLFADALVHDNYALMVASSLFTLGSLVLTAEEFPHG